MNNNYAITTSTSTNEFINQFIVFEIKEYQYGINIQDVIEVIKLPQIEFSQTTPEGVIGIFNYNGTIIKVIDICPLLGFETNNFNVNNQLIIISNGNSCYALHVEKIINIIQADNEKIQNLPYDSEASLVKEIYKTNDSAINIIDTQKIEELIAKNSNKSNEIKYELLFPNDEKSKQILELRAKQNKKEHELFSFQVDNSTTNQYVLFTLNEQNYYLDLKYVKEMTSLKRLNVTKLPYTQDHIKGMVNIKGDFLVVLDLKNFLNDEKSEITKNSKLIIVESKNFNLAFLVDDIQYIKNIEDNRKIEMNKASNSPYIACEFMEEDKLYSILNFEKIINDERLYVNIK